LYLSRYYYGLQFYEVGQGVACSMQEKDNIIEKEKDNIIEKEKDNIILLL